MPMPLYSISLRHAGLGFDVNDLTLSLDGVTGTFFSLNGSGADYSLSLPDVAGDGTITLRLRTERRGLHHHQSGRGSRSRHAGLSGSVTIDNTPPVITLNGDASIELMLGALWIHASASDTLDGIIPVTTGGDVVDTGLPAAMC